MSPAERVASALAARRQALADALVEREFAGHPEPVERYGPTARQKCLQDALSHIDHLRTAVALDNGQLFIDYIAWAKIVLLRRGERAADLAFHLECMQHAVSELLDAADAVRVLDVITAVREVFDSLPASQVTFIDADQPLAALAHQYTEALLRTDRGGASELVRRALQEGTPIRDLYLHVFQRSQHEIGRLWQLNEISVAREHYCTAATQFIMSQLYPQIFSARRIGRTLVAASVAGELHEIGVRMVADFFEMEGWDTHFLGASTPADGVVQLVVEQQADLLALSATLTPHVDAVAQLIDLARATPGCERTRILVGGHPFNADPDLYRRVGADAFAPDAQVAVALVHDER